jgi:hypothetical protein
MGWLGYTEQQTLNTSIPALEGALDAHIEMRRLVQAGQFAAAVGVESPEPPPPPASADIMAAFRRAAAPKG